MKFQSPSMGLFDSKRPDSALEGGAIRFQSPSMGLFDSKTTRRKSPCWKGTVSIPFNEGWTWELPCYDFS